MDSESFRTVADFSLRLHRIHRAKLYACVGCVQRHGFLCIIASHANGKVTNSLGANTQNSKLENAKWIVENHQQFQKQLNFCANRFEHIYAYNGIESCIRFSINVPFHDQESTCPQHETPSKFVYILSDWMQSILDMYFRFIGLYV